MTANHDLARIVNVRRVEGFEEFFWIATVIDVLLVLLVNSLLSNELAAGVSVEENALVALSGVDLKAWPLPALVLVGHPFNAFGSISLEEPGESADLLVILLSECILHDSVEVLEHIGHHSVSFLRNQLVSHLVFVLDSLDGRVVCQFNLELQIQLHSMLS